MLLICGANMSEYETSVGVTEHGQHVGRGIVGRTQAPQAIISNIIQDSLPGQFVNNSYYLPALDSISKIQFGDFWASGCLYNTKSPIKIQKSPEKIRIKIISQTIYKISFIKQPRVDMIERYFHNSLSFDSAVPDFINNFFSTAATQHVIMFFFVI